MATLKQIELPDELLRSIEKRAVAHGVSVEEQMLRDLRAVATGRKSLSEEELLAALRREREELAARGVWVTDEDINAAKRWGRE